MRIISLLLTLCFCTFGLISSAQTGTKDPQDLFHSNGKIYVVVVLILIIFSGIFIKLMTIRKKISDMEK